MMESEERNVWKYLVREANRYGRDGKRVLSADVFCPSTAASNYVPFLILDNGPRTATEDW